MIGKYFSLIDSEKKFLIRPELYLNVFMHNLAVIIPIVTCFKGEAEYEGERFLLMPFQQLLK